jgi:hypothetical protein
MARERAGNHNGHYATLGGETPSVGGAFAYAFASLTGISRRSENALSVSSAGEGGRFAATIRLPSGHRVKNLTPAWLTAAHSRPRGWLVGTAVGVPAVALLLAAFPAFFEQHEWVIWAPVLLAWWIGYRARETVNPLAILMRDARRLAVGGLILAVGILAFVFVPGIADALVARITPADLPGLSQLTVAGFGFIAWALFLIARALDRLSGRVKLYTRHFGQSRLTLHKTIMTTDCPT